GSVATRLIGETSVATLALKARIPWLLTCLNTAQERLEGAVQAGEYVVHHRRVEVVILRTDFLDARQLSTLVCTGASPVMLTPRVCQASRRSWSAALSRSRQRRRTNASLCSCKGVGTSLYVKGLRAVCDSAL